MGFFPDSAHLQSIYLCHSLPPQDVACNVYSKRYNKSNHHPLLTDRLGLPSCWTTLLAVFRQDIQCQTWSASAAHLWTLRALTQLLRQFLWQPNNDSSHCQTLLRTQSWLYFYSTLNNANTCTIILRPSAISLPKRGRQRITTLTVSCKATLHWAVTWCVHACAQNVSRWISGWNKKAHALTYRALRRHLHRLTI